MPPPPRIGDLDKVNFVVNYFLQGCVPPFWLFIECAKEPAEDLLLLLLLPDLTDIVQAMFNPGGQRHRRPGRHGRKSGRGVGFPDTSDLVGERIRATVNPHNALDFGPTRKLFKLINVYEGVAFSAAVLEGVTDTAFGGLLGVLSTHPENCPTMGYFNRNQGGISYILAPVQPWNPMNAPVLVSSHLFTTSDGHRAIDHGFRYIACLAATVYNWDIEPMHGIEIALADIDGNIRVKKGPYSLGVGETLSINCSTSFGPHEACTWLARSEYGNPLVLNWEIFGFKAGWGT